MNKRITGMTISAIIGFAIFYGFIHYASQIQNAYRDGTSNDLGLGSFLIPIGLFFAAGACGIVFDQFRLSGETEQETRQREVKESTSAKINEGKLLGGVVVLGLAIFEASNGYFARNYLVQYQDTELLRNFYSSALFPILIGLSGLGLIYAAVKPLFANPDED